MVHKRINIFCISAGAHVIIHPTRSFPSLPDKGFLVGPGTSSHVSLTVSRRLRKKPPYGECTDTEFMTVYNRTYIYDAHVCLLLCHQRYIRRKCGCISSNLPDEAETETADGRSTEYCGHLDRETMDYQRLYARKRCEVAMMMEFFETRSHHACDCKPRCEEMRHHMQLSHTSWPHKSFQQDFYAKFVVANAKRPGRGGQKAYNLSRHIAASAIADNGFIERNFLRINMFLADRHVKIAEEQPQHESANLFSAFGGSLGLWVGMSILTVYEFVDFLSRLVVKSCRRLLERRQYRN